MTLAMEKNAIQKAVAGLKLRTRAFIGGKYVDAVSGTTYASENPANGKVLAQIAQCDAKDVDLAVASARKTFDEAGKAEGGKIILGGKQVLKETGGYFVELTIFDNVRNDMKIAKEEIFGPVLSTIPFRDEAQGVAIANDTNYGLAASLYSDNINRAHRMARAIQAGTVSVNCYSEGDITTPFGGYKESGFMGRDKSIHAHEQYTLLKTIWMQLSK